MKARESLRGRLRKTKTIPEIESMIKDVENDPDSKAGATGINIYNKAATKKLDEMSWAIYDISKKNKGQFYRTSPSLERKYW